MTDQQPDAYLVEQIREALAHDPRVAELGIAVTVTDETVVLTGDVATPERREAVGDVVTPLVGGRTLCNAVVVPPLGESDEPEHIS